MAKRTNEAPEHRGIDIAAVSISMFGHRLVVGSLAVVADKLETAEHLTDGEEAEALSKDDTASGELGSANVANLLEELLGRGDQGTGAETVPEGLVERLEGGERAGDNTLATS